MSITLPRPSDLSSETRTAALGGALGYLLVLLGSWYWAYGSVAELGALLLSVQVGPWLWWAILGGALVGAVLAISFVRYDLLSPLVVVAAVYAVMTYFMWQAMQARGVLLPGKPYDLYLIGWPPLLGAAVAVGYLEHRVRSSRSPDEPS
ncbi:hypothetical protein B4589_011545 [Halolamina sp. CBA1230]|uniref:hypothetical protein n=1 Tax=Halolamina sp. CBA1230 TaxID=1853690 RepID=UPI0009A1BCED|nr:hypothetical protein [Halolamina sp. CBA1230]QKY20976.1 hypothetical protein B4589_011545 [Halolamina sp. CBA1230]